MPFITSRRRFLGGASASLLAAPFWRILNGEALASETIPKRLVVFFSPNGTIHEHLWPQGTEHDFVFPEGSILEPLASHQEDLIVLKGLDLYNADNHEGGMAAMLTNGGGSESVTNNRSLDQIVAEHISGGCRFPSLELGVHTSAWGGSVQTRMSYAGPGIFVTPDDSPSNVYQRMFGELLVGEEEASKRRLRRQMILDRSKDEINALSSRLGSQEQVKLEAHLASLEQLENSINAVPECAPSVAPDAFTTYGNDQFPAITTAQMDLAVTALACDMTRVVSLQLSHTVGPTVFSWLGINEGHHSLSHAADSNLEQVLHYVQCERWYAEQFSALLTLLKNQSDPETGGSLLDTTLVVWAQELGDGRMHTCTDVPFVLAGGGAFETGRFLDVGSTNHCHLLISIAQAFGLDLDTFGDPQAGSGPLGVL
ncbi:MAG: Tat (twin-arginine translocation) pathway signal sequence domain protein [Proteobacteria bacterium]|nr:Tat (twin-arginine translocation) pathway signal sequence domain protein [Pseudomonadota bacterium]